MTKSTAPHALVTLLSGGADSAIMAALALDRGDTIWPLYIRQGFVWEDEEIAAARRFLSDPGLPGRDRAHPLAIATCVTPTGARIRWATDASLAPPDADSPDEAVYLPGRNLTLLGQAAVLADAVGAERIALGVLRGNPFPDATDEFFRAFERSADLALGREIKIETPLGAMGKTEVLRLGARYPLQHTLSCLRPREGVHCGACNKCAERRRAFAQAAIPDPSRYATAEANKL